MVKSWIVGTDGVLDWFDGVVKTPYFSVWNGKQICYSWSENDLDKGRDMLETNLRVFETNKVGDPFILKLHPALDKNDLITDKSPVYASLNFRVFDSYALQPGYAATGAIAFENNPKLQALSDKVDHLSLLLDREPEPEPAPGFMGSINKVLEIPGVSDAVAPLIGALTNMVLKGLNLPVPAPAPVAHSGGALSGISEDQEIKINQALDILEQVDPNLGDSLLRLAAIAQKDPNKFKTLLSMLSMYE